MDRPPDAGAIDASAAPVDDVANEVAELYHDRGVRIGHLVDDNLLGPDPVTPSNYFDLLGVRYCP